MNVGFNYNEPADNTRTKIYFEQVFAEKPAGGIVANPSYDVEPSTAVGKGADGLWHPIKAARLVAANTTSAANIKVAKGHGIVKNDVLAYGKVAVACTNVTEGEEFDTITIKMGVSIPAGAVLYQAKAASADAAEPIYTPQYVVGDVVYAGKGDQRIKLVNGANLRKETACIAEEIAALMPTIALV